MGMSLSLLALGLIAAMREQAVTFGDWRLQLDPSAHLLPSRENEVVHPARVVAGAVFAANLES